MAGNLTNYAEEKILDHSVGDASWSMPTVYWALYNTDPTETGAAGAEVKTPGQAGYSRQSGVAFDAYNAGTISNTAAITWGPAADGTWSVVNYVAALDAASGGNMIWYGPTTQKTVGSGDSYQIAAGNLDLSLD